MGSGFRDLTVYKKVYALAMEIFEITICQLHFAFCQLKSTKHNEISYYQTETLNFRYI